MRSKKGKKEREKNIKTSKEKKKEREIETRTDTVRLRYSETEIRRDKKSNNSKVLVWYIDRF